MPALHVIISGRVQGVGYRAFVAEMAHRHGLAGWVRNVRDGTVEAVISGEAEAVAAMKSDLAKGPLGARIDHVFAADWTGDIPAGFSVLATQ